MRVELRCSESLLSIYREAGRELAETIVLDLDKPTTIKQILSQVGIKPILVPLIIIDQDPAKEDTLVNKACSITLIGPLAGG